MEDHGDGICVVPEVDELLGPIAVVRVDRDQPGPHGGHGALEVLGAVVEVERDLVLVGRPEAEEPGGHPAAAPLEVGPAQPALTLDDGEGVGLDGGDLLEELAIVPHVHVPLLASCGSRASASPRRAAWVAQVPERFKGPASPNPWRIPLPAGSTSCSGSKSIQ